MKNYLIIFCIILNFSNVCGQPSCAMGLEFKVFINGEIVQYDSLVANYQLLDVYNNKCSFGFRKFGTDGVKKTMSFIGGTGCYDLKKKIVFQKDTMVLKLKYHSKQDFEQYTIDSLIFKKGKYLIQENKLDKLNSEKSATDYYNELVQFARERRKTNPKFKSKELNELRSNFNISINDYDNKTEGQLFPKNENSKKEIFIIRSPSFIINDLQCNWKYEVKYIDETNDNSKTILVDLVSQKLVDITTNQYILELDLSLFHYSSPLNISYLESNNFKSQDFDINFDGYNDFQFYDRVQGEANHEYFVYIFNPISKKFEFSQQLTGGSMADAGIELDKKKRIAYYSGKNGGGLYGFKRVHFNSDGSIKYEERFWNEDLDYYSFKDSINHYKYAYYYLRKKNNITIDSLRVEKEVNDGGLESIYEPFFEWIRTFDKK